MTNGVNKSTKKSTTAQELVLMRYSIRAMRDQINAQLDGMLDRINRLLPADDDLRCKRQKNYKKEDWHKFLGF